VRLTGLRGASKAVVAAELVRAHADRPVLILGSSAKQCDVLLDDLRSTLGERPDSSRLHVLPRHDTLPYDRFSPQPFVVAQRMDVLYRWLVAREPGPLAEEPPPVVVSDWTALALRVPAPATLRAYTREIAVGDSLDRDEMVAGLVEAGYARMPIVQEPGEIAVRGGIVDLYPPHSRHPLRVEFFGDEIDGIREFDPASQRSQAKLAHAVAPPPRELLFDRDTVVARGDAIRALAERLGTPAGAVAETVDALLRGHLPPGVEAIAPILQPDQSTVLDYLPEDALVLLDEPDAGHDRLARYFAEAATSHAAALETGRLVAPVDDLLVDPARVEAAIAGRQPVSLERLAVADPDGGAERIAIPTTDHAELRRALSRTRTHEQALAPLADRIAEQVLEGWRTVVAVSALSSAERLKDLLSKYGLESSVVTDPRPCWHWSLPGRVEIRVSPLSEGFTIPMQKLAVVTEEEIFGKREKRRHRTSWKEGVAVEGIAQLQPGDFLVHADHGIGLYRGLDLLRTGAGTQELLCIEYAGGDKLFLPVHRLNLVARYAAFEGVTPKLDRLGGESWRKAKGRVRKSLRNMASELLSMHAARELAPGFAFGPRDAYFEEFEGAFAFEETPDQSAAIEDVLADMQRPRPMDRLVCGDVGYGKTEVAIRAAFRAAMDGKQVAVLTPTTILCEQHFETFEQRFDGYPIRVEMLSRFRSPKETKAVLEGLATGQVDVVVATHRILGRNVRFHDLGLLVVDEEQRFGVAHKERIKQLKRTVDVLTLTATPIPRTLQMAFTGLRDLSVIDTPPVDRLAIRTQIARRSDSLIREAILREVRRGGQVYFVHNRVASIGSVAETLARVVPEVKVIVAHGQMKESELEDRMHAFVHGEAEVLLCTTIVESGLDIPRANTILIDRADTLGLAQLYQLRGRVGRSNRRAYAYFLIPAQLGSLRGDAQRRLEAIQDLTELGSGFRLANMDLEIRGAGDLLGSGQSGNLRAVGYETYMEMLEETIEELRGQVPEASVDPEIRLPVTARLPDDYVPEVGQRLALYKRLSSARDGHDVDRIRDEILDRYGAMPTDAENLLQVIRLKILARRLGIASLTVTRGELVLQVAESSRIDPQRLVRLLSDGTSRLRVSPDHRIYAPAPGPEGGAPALFDAAREVLRRLGRHD
jgi:transcription-repair coupling factor (superfamily II helicase)